MRRILLLLIFSCFLTQVYAPAIPGEQKWNAEKYFRSSKLTPERLMEALLFSQVVSPAIVFNQAILESGHFSSKICRENNNLFGMKRPLKRLTTAKGSSNKGYSIYNCWYDSVKDMKLFQEYYILKGRDLTDYPAFLISIGYAEDRHYIRKISAITHFI